MVKCFNLLSTLTFEWERMCTMRWVAVRKLLLHCWHGNGLAPEWTRSCTVWVQTETVFIEVYSAS